MVKFSAMRLGSAIRGSIASAFAVMVLAHPAAASLLEFTFTSGFDTHTGGGGGSFFPGYVCSGPASLTSYLPTSAVP